MITETANPSEQVETAPVVAGAPTRSWTWATAVCTVAIFLGASLLFIAEMMVGKMVLPLLGGTPAVWNTCLMFFQAALLAGYGYAHWASRRLDVRRLTRVHVALLVLAAATLPVAIGPDRVPPSAAAPVWWLLGLLLTTIGAPFVLLAGTGPMLQRWFTASGHPRAHDPYFLFAASNLGSFAGLVGYPLLIEPAIGLSAQSLSWAAGYILLIGLVGGSALLLRPVGRPVAVNLPGDRRAPSRRDRIWWVALAFVPSSLLLGVTAHLSTDIAAFPLLWVVPLALYLLTFVVAFAATPFGGARSRRWLALTFLLVVLAQFVLMRADPIVLLVLHLLPFTLAALGLHSELARRRPGGGRLTEYYLWIAFGGALGGVFNALVAPLVFDTVLEYPIMLVAAAALLSAPRADAPRARRPPPIALAFATVAGLALSWAIQQYVGGVSLQGTRAVIAYGATMLAVIAVLLLHRAGRGGLLMAVCLAAALWAARRVERSRGEVLITVRDFFGVYKVGADRDGKYRIFQHGTTTHGVQATDSARRREPLSYYVRTGPLGDIFAGEAAPGRRVGVIGLGAGGMLAYAAPSDAWTYFEIAPAVERIARDTAFFTYLADAPSRTEVILGDARLSLARDPRRYDVLVLDAFSSDAIPVHLLTREAARLYAARLAPGGMLVLHISNRFFNLDPVVAGIADVTGMTARIRLDRTSALKSPREAATSRWAVLARHPEDLGAIGANPEWHAPDRSRTIVWTDDHSNVLSVFRWTRR